MNRALLAALNAPSIVILALICIGIQTSLFSSYPLLYLQPDITLLLVVWLALKRQFIEGGVLTLILSWIAEVHSSAPAGTFMSAYMAIYFLLRGMNILLRIVDAQQLIIVAMLASISWKLVHLGILALLGCAEAQWRHTLTLLLPGAVMEGILAIWVFRGLDRLDFYTGKDDRSRKAEGDFLLEDEGF